MKRRLYAVLIVLMITFIPVCSVQAEDIIKIYIDGKALSSDVAPVSVSGRTLVPLRAIFESLGATVTWDGATKTAKGFKGNTVVELIQGSTKAKVNGREVILDVPATAISGRTMVPARFVAESLGARVDWDNSTKAVNIYAAGTFDYDRVKFNADFRVMIGKGVYWVPAGVLGKPKLLKEEIKAFNKDPETLQKNINTVYDAVQYIKLIDFKTAPDNKKIREGNIEWEFHKPALEAIRTNCGGCADISNLVRFLLKGDYEEEGYITYTVSEGSGHVYNYFKQNGKYYFVDFTKHFNDFPPEGGHAPETGNLNDFNRSDRAEGNVMEADSVEDYISYLLSIMRNPPVLYTMYNVDGDSLVLGQIRENNHITDCFKKVDNFKVIHDIQGDNVDVLFNNGPGVPYPTW